MKHPATRDEIIELCLIAQNGADYREGDLLCWLDGIQAIADEHEETTGDLLDLLRIFPPNRHQKPRQPGSC